MHVLNQKMNLSLFYARIQYDENDPQTGENEETGYTSSSSSDTVDINTVLAGPSGVNPDNEIYVCDEPKCEPSHQCEPFHQEEKHTR